MNYLFWDLLGSISSFISMFITLIAVIIAFRTYYRDYTVKLAFKEYIGEALNTGTCQGTYGICLNIQNMGNRDITILETILQIGQVTLNLYPNQDSKQNTVQNLILSKRLNIGDECVFNFAPSYGQMKYFLSNNKDKELMSKQNLLFNVKTTNKEYKIKSKKTCADFFAEYFNFYSSSEEKNDN